MEDEIKRNLGEIQDYIESVEYDLLYAKQTLDNLWDKLEDKSNNSIKDIDNLKRELKRDGLYSDKLEEFLENYMKYYNK
jgi:DNA anti-recombination protein RmuC